MISAETLVYSMISIQHVTCYGKPEWSNLLDIIGYYRSWGGQTIADSIESHSGPKYAINVDEH